MTLVAEQPRRTLYGEEAERSARRGIWFRLVRGRQEDPAWVRPAIWGLLVATAVAYTWALSDSGWANSFYAAAVQAGAKSWKAFFFGSSDPSNFITVDKPPASLWVMELSARIFGVNSWSILVPQACEGVAAVGLLYVTVRRWFSPGAALIAGIAMASTPVAVLMFRYNNPDALLTLLFVVAAYATVRAVESARTRWLVVACVAVGTGFLTKELEALLVLPAIGLVYVIAAPTSLTRRIKQVLVAAIALLLSSGWWVAAVMLIPAADRPYIGGSRDNNLLNVIFGYNGFGRLSGNESGSVGGAGPPGSRWGPTGLIRLFQTDMGGQISWLLPAALILFVVGLFLLRKSPRTDRCRAALLLFGLWMVVGGLVFSYAQGIIHPYYNIALAPPIGAVVGIGGVMLWNRRHRLVARISLAVVLCATSAWSFVLLERSPQWLPWLRTAVVIAGPATALALIFASRMGRRLLVILGATGLSVALAGPVAYALDTVNTPHSGAIPSAGPSVPGGGGAGLVGFGGGFSPFGRGAHGRFRAGGPIPFAGRPTGAGFAGPGPAPRITPGLIEALVQRFRATGGFSRPGFPRRFGGNLGARPGGPGAGFLSSPTPGPALVKLLETSARAYTWVAATVNSNSAAGYQLATGDAVMAIGGFNGTDPAPTLAQFQRYVKKRKIHYFIAGGGFGFGAGGTATAANQVTNWVENNFASETVDGVALYDLAARLSQPQLAS